MKIAPQNKKYVIVGAIIIALIILYLLVKPRSTVDIATPKKAEDQFNIQPAAPVKNDNYPLQIGSNGPNVKQLQQYLNTLNDKSSTKVYAPLVVDGDFGTKTKDALTRLAGAQYYPVSQTYMTTIYNKTLYTSL